MSVRYQVTQDCREISKLHGIITHRPVFEFFKDYYKNGKETLLFPRRALFHMESLFQTFCPALLAIRIAFFWKNKILASLGKNNPQVFRPLIENWFENFI